MTDNRIVHLQDIRKVYDLGKIQVPALQGIDLTVQRGDYVAIMGSSGSGKSTLLNILGCLDRPTGGVYTLGGRDVSTLNDNDLSEVRSEFLGFVFQSYNLIPQLTVLENIEVPLFYRDGSSAENLDRCAELAERVGLGDRLHHRPNELSGGQQQRVAVARALANDPLVILADEPTGNLDTHTEAEILDLIDELNAGGTTIIMVTHEVEVSHRAGHVVHLLDGRVDRIDGREV